MSAAREYRQSGTEKKEGDTVLHIETAYLGEDRERRIVHNHTIGRVFCMFIIATRIKRTKNLFAFQWIHLTNILQYRFINILRSPTLVSSLRILLEFCKKRLVIIKDYGVSTPPPPLRFSFYQILLPLFYSLEKYWYKISNRWQ